MGEIDWLRISYKCIKQLYINHPVGSSHEQAPFTANTIPSVVLSESEITCSSMTSSVLRNAMLSAEHQVNRRTLTNYITRKLNGHYSHEWRRRQWPGTGREVMTELHCAGYGPFIGSGRSKTRMAEPACVAHSCKTIVSILVR